MPHYLQKDLKEIFTTIGLNEEQSNQLTESIIVEVFDKTYYELLSEDDRKLLEKALADRDAKLAKEVQSKIDQNTFIKTVEFKTQEVVTSILKRFIADLPVNLEEEFIQNLQKIRNKELLKDLDTQSSDDALRALSQ